jgi:hypothetical protein
MDNSVLSDTTFIYPREYNKKSQLGGENINKPTGSFPPIYEISQEQKEKEEKDKNRGFATLKNKSSVSIKEIMQERREEKKPFLEL